jgi:hypothetical protein
MSTGTPIPAICDDCGTVFVSTSMIALGGGGAVTITGSSVGPCPACGGVGSIPDGTYESVGGVVVKYLAAPSVSAQHLRRLREVLIEARNRGQDAAETAAAVDAALPGIGLGGAVRDMARSPVAVAWLTILIMVISILITHRDAQTEQPSMSPQEVKSIVQTALNRAAQEPRPPAHAGRQPKVGRNDACPCGSGLKFKRCHGRS